MSNQPRIGLNKDTQHCTFAATCRCGSIQARRRIQPNTERMKTIQIHDKKFLPYISREHIRQRVMEIGKAVSEDYRDRTPLIIVVLKGAIVFASDLIRELTCDCTVETITARSYGDAMQSSGSVTLLNSLPDVRGKDVILVEDIIDTGLTLHIVREAMMAHQPASVAIACLLSKPTMHKIQLPIAYCCFEIPPAFVVGYGLDYAEHGRNLPEIYQVTDDENNGDTYVD